MTKETDPRSHQAFLIAYDSYGRVTDQYDSFNNHTTFSYNISTQTTTVTDPLGKVTTTLPNGLLVSRHRPLLDTTSYAYDANRT